LTFDKKLVRY